MEKICSKCKVSKELSLFNVNKKAKNGVSAWCKECFRDHIKNHYVQNKQKYLDNYKKISYKKREWYNLLKQNKKCEKCGIDHPAVLDFHHIDPNQKEFSISEMFGRRGGNGFKEKVLDEMKKCILLCSNCHRIFHYIETKTKITIQEYLEMTHN